MKKIPEGPKPLLITVDVPDGTSWDDLNKAIDRFWGLNKPEHETPTRDPSDATDKRGEKK